MKSFSSDPVIREGGGNFRRFFRLIFAANQSAGICGVLNPSESAGATASTLFL